ncbi:putative invertase inhibitor [Hibiscus syriacus]|nr:putative invertase inhibitor [Hibiscus syriacus]
MRHLHVSFLSFSCFFMFLFLFLFLLTPYDEISGTRTSSFDLINKTRTTCSHKSIVFNYTFCLASLLEIPSSHMSNLQGLAIVATELALRDATRTLSVIKGLLRNETSGLRQMKTACLRDCDLLYSDGVVTLVDSVGAFLEGRYGDAGAWVTAVMEGTTTCEEGFRDVDEASPLTERNYSLFQLCDVALCIMNLLGSDVLSF